MGLVESLNPPIMSYAKFGEPGQVTTDSVTIFFVSPAVDGKLLWNLAIDGEFESPLGTYAITPLGDNGLQCTVTLWGPGGSSGGVGSSGVDTGGGSGAATTFAGMSAGPGGPSGAADRGGNSNGGNAGVAAGGISNTDGSAGGNGSSNGTATAGFGAAAPSGGAQIDGATVTGSSAGINGNPPGGGARGAAATWTDGGTPRSGGSGGGGSGGKCVKTFGAGVLLKGVAYPLVVGDSGVAGTGNRAAGAKGAPGRVVIS